MAIIQICVVLVSEVAVWSPTATNPAPDVRFVTDRRLVRLAWTVYAAGWLVLYLGTVVTGSGSHAGDGGAGAPAWTRRSSRTCTAIGVYLLVALTVGLLALAYRVRSDAGHPGGGCPPGDSRLAGAVGFTQYYLDLPEGLVALHLWGGADVRPGWPGW